MSKSIVFQDDLLNKITFRLHRVGQTSYWSNSMTDRKTNRFGRCLSTSMINFRRFLSRITTMDKRALTLVVALDDCNGIGRNNTIPWHIKNDLKFFRYVTMQRIDPNKQNAVIIGRKTYETFPKPLPNRLNIVVSSNPSLANINYPNVVRVNTFPEAFNHAIADSNIENIFIAGGVSIYEEAMKTNLVKRLFVTRVKGDFQCTAIWSSFNVEGYRRVEIIPDEYRQFFDHSEENQEENEKTPICHLEIYERDI